jgi:dsRNA-specific ribonuclease
MRIQALIRKLRAFLEKELKRAEKTKDQEKICHWLEQLDWIRNRIEEIRTRVKTPLEKDLQIRIPDDLLITALSQPSVRNLFLEIAVYVRGKTDLPVAASVLQELAYLPDRGNVLAWVGDAAINLAVLEEIWSAVDVGVLTERRREYVQNSNLARVCDRWGLYSLRIHFDPPTDPAVLTKETVVRVKGTLTEAIYGILFFRGGLNAVVKAMYLLRPPL